MPGAVPKEANPQTAQRPTFLEKCRQEPLVPVGCFATVCALSLAGLSFRKGQCAAMNTMMQARVVAQGFTVAAITIGGGMFGMTLWPAKDKTDARFKSGDE